MGALIPFRDGGHPLERRFGGAADNPGWTAAREARLRELIRDWPASMIARELGISRNAVIGKAYRLGIALAPPGKIAMARGADGASAEERARARAERRNAADRAERARALRDDGSRAAPPRRKNPAEEAAAAEIQALLAGGKGETIAGDPCAGNPAFRALPGDLPKTLIGLDQGQCRWPLVAGACGEALEETHYCGRPAEAPPGRGYCAAHRLLSVRRDERP